VVYINPKGKVLRLTDYQDIDFPNGIALSHDGSRLFIGSNETVVWMFDIQQADGTITNKRPFAHINLELDKIGKAGAKSLSDGMKFDSDGNLYITSQTCIQVFDKAGGYIGTILIPTVVANLNFGGDDLKTLYLTGLQNIYTLKVNVPGQ
jgi:gluconolactonase